MRAALPLGFALSLLPYAAGCTAVRMPHDPSPAQREEVAAAHLPKLVVGVRAPVLKLDPETPADQPTASIALAEIESARRLILRLRATRLFERVDFATTMLGDKADLILIPLGPSQEERRAREDGSSLPLILLCMLTAGVIPNVATTDERELFARADAPERALEFSFPMTEVSGFVAPVLATTTAWHAIPGDSLETAFAVFLLEHRDEIWRPDPSD